MYSVKDTTNVVGFPIRKSADQCLLAANRSLTQPITSFIAFIRQGIHQMLLLNAWIEITRSDKTALFRLLKTNRNTLLTSANDLGSTNWIFGHLILSVCYTDDKTYSQYTRTLEAVCFWQKAQIVYAPFPVHKLLKFTFIRMNLRS